MNGLLILPKEVLVESLYSIAKVYSKTLNREITIQSVYQVFDIVLSLGFLEMENLLQIEC